MKLDEWLENETIREGLRPTLDKNYVDLDPTFAATVDEDYDHRLSGVSKNSFTNVYLDWVQYCAGCRDKVNHQVLLFGVDSGKIEMNRYTYLPKSLITMITCLFLRLTSKLWWLKIM